MTQATFAEILEATEQLPPEDQEQLIHILTRLNNTSTTNGRDSGMIKIN